MILFDTETTGLLMPEVADLTQQPDIIEVALLKLGPKYKELERYTTLVKPSKPLDEELHKTITGLTNAELDDAPIFLEVWERIAELCLGERVLVAHNMAFDIGMLIVELRRINKQHAFPYPPEQICTVERTKHLRGRRLKLTELYEMKIKKPLKQTHRAMDDVDALARIVKEMKI